MSQQIVASFTGSMIGIAVWALMIEGYDRWKSRQEKESG